MNRMRAGGGGEIQVPIALKYEHLRDVSQHFTLVFPHLAREKWALRKIKKLFLGVVVASPLALAARRLGTLQAAVCRCGRNLESASPFFFFSSLSLSLSAVPTLLQCAQCLVGKMKNYFINS